jgi:hypothetical protein
MPISSPIYKPIVSTGSSQISIIEETTIANQATITLPSVTKGIMLRSRTVCELKVSDSLGGPFITIKPRCTLELEILEITGKILYIESSIAITTIEALITHG